MPERPREHVLETLSEHALQAALPATWTTQEVRPDYGLDRRVEIFQDGHTTGLMFWAQLRATDDPPPAALKLSLNLEQLAYWQSLDMPVLLVRYSSADGGQLHWMWAHTVDRHYGRGTKSYTVTFEESHRWHRDTPARLALDVELFRQARTRQLPTPLPVHLHLPDVMGGATRDELRYRIGGALTQTPLLHLAPAQPSDEPHRSLAVDLHVLPNRLMARLTAGFPTLTVHHPDLYSTPDTVQLLPLDLLLVLAHLIAMTGHNADAATLAAAAAPGGLLVHQWDAAFALVRLFERAGRPTAALAFTEPRSDAPDDERAVAHFLRISALHNARCLDDADAERLEAQLREVIRVEAEHNSSNVGTAWHALASFLRNRGRIDDAVAAFEAGADEGTPPYRDRGYFQREYAGMLFEAGRYAEAAAAYGKAVTLAGDTPDFHEEVVALHADALMLAGRYREARDAFAGTPWTQGDWGGEWRLKQLVLDHVLTTQGVDAQERRPLEEDPPEDLTPEVIDRFLTADALDLRIWSALATRHLRSAEPEQAFYATLVVATGARYEPLSWFLALALGVLTGAPEVTVADIVHTGLRFCGHTFADLADRTGKDLEGHDPAAVDEAAAVRAALFRHAAAIPRSSEPLAVRSAESGWTALPLEG